MIPIPKSHHYLPRHHLSRFAADRDNPKVVVYDKKTGKSFCTGVVNAACENHLYTINPGGSDFEKDASTIEGLLARIDGDAAMALDMIEDIEIIPDEIKYFMNLYISSLLLRTPYSIQRNIEIIRPVMQEACERMLRYDDDLRRNLRKDMGLGERDFDDFVQKMINGGMTVTPNRSAAMEMSIQNIPKIAEALSFYSWEYLEAPDCRSFIACDNPAFICDPVTLRSESIGVSTPPVELTMPVSSRICVVGKPTGTPQSQRFRVATSDEVREINRRTAVAGFRFIYCEDFCPEIKDMVNALSESCPFTVVQKLKSSDGKSIHIPITRYPVTDFLPVLDHCNNC